MLHRLFFTHRGRLLIGLLVALTIWGFADVRRRGYAFPDSPEKHKTDLTVYTEAGAAFFDGRPPYDVCNPRGWTYVYPPMFALLLAPLHALPMQDQTLVWFFLCLGMCWGIFRESGKILAAIHAPEDDAKLGPLRWIPWLSAAVAMAVTLPTLNCLQRGQVSIAIAYLMLLGLRWVLTGRRFYAFFLGGVILGLAINIKIVPLLPIGVLLFMQMVGYAHRRWKLQPSATPLARQCIGASAGVGLGMVLFFFLVPAALIGWSNNLRHLDTWAHRVLFSAGDSTATPGFENDTHSVRNQCLGNAIYRLGNFGAYMFAGGPEDPLVDDDHPPPRMMDAASVNTTLLFVRFSLLLALMLVSLRLGLRAEVPVNQAAGFGLACAALLVLSPVARNHYFVILTPAVLFVPVWLNQRGRRGAAIVLALIPIALIGLQYVFLAYVGRVGLLGLGMTGWLMAAMVLMDRVGRNISEPTAVSIPPRENRALPLHEAA